MWSPLNNGLVHGPSAIAIGLRVLDDGTGPTMYLAGFEDRFGSGPWQSRWNGSAWSELPPGMYVVNTVGPLISFNDGTGSHLYGWRVTPTVAAAVRWDGTQWQDLGAPSDGSIYSLAALDLGSGAQLYACGPFLHIGGVAASNIARWDGSAWHALPGTLGLDYPRAMCVYDDGSGPALYIGGTANGIGGSYTPLYKYDGTQITPVPGLSSGGIFQINEMAVFDDGTGPGLYAAGYIPGVVNRYDGHQWSALGAGLNGSVPSLTNAMAVVNDGRGPSLVMVGTLFQAGGGDCHNIAQWVGCPNCYANCDNSTLSPRLNVLDFLCFLNKFAARDPYANCTVDATIDIADFICFLNKFAAGCP